MILLLALGCAAPDDGPLETGWTLVWSDSFDGAAGTAPDPDVWVPDVGSTTAVEVRDSPPIRAKSLRIASLANSSMIRSPVRPPARPVATTGTPSRLSVRATMIPLPPASERPWLARWRWPPRKFGTVSVRSIAALRVISL